MLSMTGYGKSKCILEGKSLLVEIKTWNSKGIDIHIRMPLWMRNQEIVFKNILQEKLFRGKIELNISEQSNNTLDESIKIETIEKYFDELKALADRKNYTDTNLISSLVKHSSTNLKEEEFEIENWNELLKSIDESIVSTNEYRAQEGNVLSKYLVDRLNTIQQCHEKISLLDPARVEKVRQKLLSGFKNWESQNIDQNRLEQEIIFYIEKLDIQEELSRLQAHIDYFFRIIEDTTIEKGKKLGFLTQEMLREANTIGSKASDAEIQHLVVMLKEEIEKIKEQTANLV